MVAIKAAAHAAAFLALCSGGLEASETSRQLYLELIERHPSLVAPQGRADKGEIEILLDKEAMKAVEKKTGRDVGLIMRDKYWLWVNDACKFPSGHEGVYGRILWNKALEGEPGVAVMPILQDGRIALNCNYRHSTRSWEMELPRGVINPGESVEAAARRETFEETGMRVGKLLLLGACAADTGITGSVVPVYAANVVEKGKAQQEESEAIEEIYSLSIPEIKQAFVRGYCDCKIRGEMQRVPFRDPFLAYALFIYELRLLQ